MVCASGHPGLLFVLVCCKPIVMCSIGSFLFHHSLCLFFSSPRHVFAWYSSCTLACFCLVLFLHHHSLCLFFSITKVPKDVSHFAVVLVVNNHMQRDEHTKGQYTCMYVWIVYSPCLLDVIDLIGVLCWIWMHMHEHTTHSARTCHMHMRTHTCSIRD